MHPCFAIGCHDSVDEAAVFCERHTLMLWPDTARCVGKSYRPKSKQTKTFLVHLELARNEILSFQLNGHKVPRDHAFEFDDEGTPT
jgi:hypothetical protein